MLNQSKLQVFLTCQSPVQRNSNVHTCIIHKQNLEYSGTSLICSQDNKVSGLLECRLTRFHCTCNALLTYDKYYLKAVTTTKFGNSLTAMPYANRTWTIDRSRHWQICYTCIELSQFKGLEVVNIEMNFTCIMQEQMTRILRFVPGHFVWCFDLVVMDEWSIFINLRNAQQTHFSWYSDIKMKFVGVWF